MEGAAIAQAAWLNGLPFVILRAISDQADEATAITYDAFEAQAAEHCAQVAARMAQLLA
jgi:adenosylhomocysteine nucleosidase